MTDTCATCIFYISGSCRQRAPMNVSALHGSGGQLVPILVAPDYWCGDGIAGDGHVFSTKIPVPAPASKWLSGDAPPADGLGNDGDWYLLVTSTTMFSIYTKVSGSWVYRTRSAP